MAAAPIAGNTFCVPAFTTTTHPHSPFPSQHQLSPTPLQFFASLTSPQLSLSPFLPLSLSFSLSLEVDVFICYPKTIGAPALAKVKTFVEDFILMNI